MRVMSDTCNPGANYWKGLRKSRNKGPCTIRHFLAQGIKYQPVIFMKPQKWKVLIICHMWIFQDCQRYWLQVIWIRISSGGKHTLYWWKRNRGKRKLNAMAVVINHLKLQKLGTWECCTWLTPKYVLSSLGYQSSAWYPVDGFRISFPPMKVSIEEIFTVIAQCRHWAITCRLTGRLIMSVWPSRGKSF